jgi:outer membrane lipoprotein-sorting protein
VCCACDQNDIADSIPKIQKKLFELKSYKAEVEMTVINNKNVTKYGIIQYYLYPGKYRLEVTSPEFLKGLVILTNEKNVWVSNSNISNTAKNSFKKQINQEISNIFITEFFSNYVKSEKSQSTIENSKNIFSTTISNGNSYLCTEKLTVNRLGNAEKLEIFDQNGNLKISLLYKTFTTNLKLNELLFNDLEN